MRTRRRLIQSAGALGSSLILPQVAMSASNSSREPMWRMPDEGSPHKRTWMAFGASKAIWGSRLLPQVQRNLALIAKTISAFEPVSMLVRPEDLPIAKQLLGSSVQLIACPLDDLWIRDSGPVFVIDQKGRKAGVDFNFNGWGGKQVHDQDAQVAKFVTHHTGVPLLPTEWVLEGGGIEVDGQGTALVTESCVLNSNRNPGMSKADCEVALKKLLGIQKIIWLAGIEGQDITDGHTDFYARFVRPGVVVAGLDSDPTSFEHAVTQRHLKQLKSSTDAQGRHLKVVTLESPSELRSTFQSKDFAAGYINFYVCNGAVIASEFGDARTDAAAKRTLQSLYPLRKVIQINIDGISAGGGGIHCATQQEPLLG